VSRLKTAEDAIVIRSQPFIGKVHTAQGIDKAEERATSHILCTGQREWWLLMLGACHLFARSLNLFPKGGRKTLTVLLPFAHDWETGMGDEGNAGFANMTGSR